MHNTLPGPRVAFLVAPGGMKRLELTEPWRALQEAGVQPELVAETRDLVRAFDDQNEHWTMLVDKVFPEADVDDYDGAVVVGGGMESETLYTLPDALRLVAKFVAQNKPVAAIGHSMRTLIEADVVSGRRISCVPELRTKMRDAGAECLDDAVVVDDGLLTSRNLGDVTAFCRNLVEKVVGQRPLTAR